MDKSLCFSSFVFGSYQKYIPYYIYSIWKTYPNAFSKIFIETELNNDINEVLNYLRNNNVNNFEIIELHTSFAEYENFRMRGSGAKTLIRWLFGEENFSGFKYVYIGDIDILFLPEKISLIDFHSEQMKILNVPFSNKVRINNLGEITERLTGLHFFETQKYFEKIEPIIAKVVKDIHFRNQYLAGLERNEHFLYKINKEAFAFDPILVSKAQRPWHGLHLGITRGNKDLDIPIIEENSSLSLNEVKYHLKEYIQDPIFRQIQRKVFVIELEVILRELSIPYSFSWRYKGFKYRSCDKWNSAKKNINRLLK